MATTTTILCDGCGKNITSHDTGYTKDRLKLRVEKIPSTSPISYAMVYYPTDANKDFCGLRCLLLWLESQDIRPAPLQG